MSKMITLEYYGVEAKGATVREAKEAAGRLIERTLKELAPRIFRFDGFTLIVFWERPGDAAYTYTSPGDADGRRLYCVCTDSTLDEAERAGRRHVADNAWTPERGLEVPVYVKDKEDRIECERRARFALEYRRLIAEGVAPDDAHERAYAARYAA